MIKKIPWKKLRNKIPHNVIINRKNYEILWCDAFLDPTTVGEKRVDPNQIVLKTGETAEETIKTLVHEVFHAISDENGAKLTEVQVQKMEKGTADMLRIFEELLK